MTFDANSLEFFAVGARKYYLRLASKFIGKIKHAVRGSFCGGIPPLERQHYAPRHRSYGGPHAIHCRVPKTPDNSASYRLFPVDGFEGANDRIPIDHLNINAVQFTSQSLKPGTDSVPITRRDP